MPCKVRPIVHYMRRSRCESWKPDDEATATLPKPSLYQSIKNKLIKFMKICTS